jgi:hypothetical protein
VGKEPFTFEMELEDGSKKTEVECSGICSCSGQMAESFELTEVRDRATGELIDLDSLDPHTLEIIKDEALQEAERQEIYRG